MPRFKINEGFKDERVVEAGSFTETGSFVEFSTYEVGQIFALPSSAVRTIERLDDPK